MRKARITGKDRFQRPAYHCMSRGYDRNWIFETPEEKEYFRGLLDKVVRFTGVELLTFCVMSNHFHLLVRVNPEPTEGLTDEALVERMRPLFSKQRVKTFERRLAEFRENGEHERAEELREPILARMHSLSVFMKELKERYSRWYNKRIGRRGTLWEDRFKSVLVEDGEALVTMAKYIDLNPVRAGLVEDPKDYRWSGYGEATAGRKAARRGLCAVFPHPRTLEPRDWDEIKTIYRVALFQKGVAYTTRDGVQKPGIDPEKVKATWERGGELSWNEVVWCKTRFLTDSLVFGSRAFVEEAAAAHPHLFGRQRPRQEKAHPAATPGLFGLCGLVKFRDGHIGAS